MPPVVAAALRGLLPARTSISQRERLRAGVGALLGILLTGALSRWAGGDGALWLMAPMGASAVIVFALPASPLAQPWPVIGGNVGAALIGVTCARFIEAPLVAAGTAAFGAIVAMFALRCLHPPSGAVALTAVLGGPAINAAGYGFVLHPVLLNSVLLLAAAVLYNNATGRRYPHTQQAPVPHPHGTTDALPTARLGFTAEDLQAALASRDQVQDISLDELEALVQQVERHAFTRRFGEARCGDIMSRDVVTVAFGTELAEAWNQMHGHDVRALPVVDRARRIVGIVTRSDFLRHADLRDYRSLGTRLRAFLRRTAHTHSDKHEVVGQIMSAPVRTVRVDTPIVDLVAMMADSGLHHVPVIDLDRRLAGMVTQTDLVGALYETALAGIAPARTR